ENPHRLHLGRVGLELTRADGSRATPDDLKNIEQTLDLWSGLLDSRFEFDGAPVRVQTCCHATLDLLAVRIDSPLIRDGRLKIMLAFPYGSPNMNMANWNAADKHTTTLSQDKNVAQIDR